MVLNWGPGISLHPGDPRLNSPPEQDTVVELLWRVVSISGEAGKEQRRFALRNLRDFGFGKSGAEEIIREEFLDMAEKLRGAEGRELGSAHLFNVNVMNVIWRMLSGSRFGYFLSNESETTSDHQQPPKTT